jgi:hypothetical protein
MLKLDNSSPVERRLIRGNQALKKLVGELADAGVWFHVEPRPHDLFQVKVKREWAHLLPPVRSQLDWEVAPDEELIDLALRNFDSDFEGSDVRLTVPHQVLERKDSYCIVAAQVLVMYPKDEA